VLSVRVLAYNVRSLRDDPAAAARVIAACAADVVCVQEAPRFARWRSKCAALARRSGLVVITGGRPAGAMLLLGALRTSVVATRDVRLTKKRGLHQRGLAIAVLDIAGARYTVASMHLDLEVAERRRHVDEVFEVLGEFPDPLVLAGDVNETPDGPAWGALAARLQDAFAVAGEGSGDTYSARRPHKRIDGIFVDPRLQVGWCRVPDVPGREAATDHLPVLAEVRPAPERAG
jgi:endonuclease/exonuclease/phosphatase family metal-dependent hydrolase